MRSRFSRRTRRGEIENGPAIDYAFSRSGESGRLGDEAMNIGITYCQQ